MNKNIFTSIREYKKLGVELKQYLSKHPSEWKKFQTKFNETLEEVSQGLTKIENLLSKKNEGKLQKIKDIFGKRYRKYFLYGNLTKHAFEKPFGYPGDFKIIDDIYQNLPATNGYDRLWDNYFLQLSASKATQERKEDFKKIIFDFIQNKNNTHLHIMSLASGSARELKDLLDTYGPKSFSNVTFDCCDFAEEALDYSKEILGNQGNINIIQKNAIKLALKKDITKELPADYDLIYSTGLFDYLGEKLATRLIANLKRLLKNGGLLVISNYREKHHNASAYLMEWITKWDLIYRSKEEFENIFINASFSKDHLKITPQRSGVMQYCVATKI